MKLFVFISILTFTSGFITSCKSDKPEVKPLGLINAKPGEGVFVLDEGNFTWGNASVDYYKLKDNSVAFDVFESINKRSLGDVLQSMTVFLGKGYLVVNNSGKIEVVNPKNFSSEATISGFVSPRYFVGIDNTKGYVSDFKSNTISIVNLKTNSKVKEIPCKGWTEEMILVNDKVYVTNPKTEYVYLIDTKTDEMDDSIKVGYSPNSIRMDKDGMVWVLCAGDETKGAYPYLVKINPTLEKVESMIKFTSLTESPYKLRINGTGDMLYYLNDGVYRFSITDNSIATTAFIQQNSMLYYGLGVDPGSGDIYVSDAIDYVQHGKVYRYKSDGSSITNFDVGIIPGDFCFF